MMPKQKRRPLPGRAVVLKTMLPALNMALKAPKIGKSIYSDIRLSVSSIVNSSTSGRVAAGWMNTVPESIGG